ncbi:MAG: thioredoxin domain-containing protein, partial [Acidobacteria bacterium]|nr:thioredoxin domain-containing protein [Acidobacteriota bacterium]
MKPFLNAVGLVCTALLLNFANPSVALAQANVGECSKKMLSERVVNYIKVNALAGAKGDARVRRIEPSGSAGICVAEVEYSLGDQSGRRGAQRVYLSSDGRFVFPRAIDLSLEARENLLNAVRIDGFPAEGGRHSPVVVIEFADFQCPPCRLSGLVVKKNIQREYGNDVLWVYKWLPSPTHSWAREAAVGSICTHLQSPADFWRLHDLLLTQQRDLSKDSLGPLLLDFA